MRIPEENLSTETIDTSGDSVKLGPPDMHPLGLFLSCNPLFLEDPSTCLEVFAWHETVQGF